VLLGVDETAAQAAHRANEAAIDRFLAMAKRKNPERFRRVCQAYPVLTQYGWRQITEHEFTNDDLILRAVSP
jgi:hypothetical protein